MAIHVQPFYFSSVVILWLIVYHIAFRAMAIARDPSVVCWSVGPFGVSTVSLQGPPLRRHFAQLGVSALALATTAYANLFVIEPAPISGLQHSLVTQVFTVAVPVVALTGTHLLGILRELRFPLWGDARVLTGVQRSLAMGARVYFTSAGRTYLSERFGATPHEFLRMVR